jgi:hypothetical protein
MAEEDLGLVLILLLAFLACLNILVSIWGREMVTRRRMRDMMRALRVWLRKT